MGKVQEVISTTVIDSSLHSPSTAINNQDDDYEDDELYTTEDEEIDDVSFALPSVRNSSSFLYRIPLWFSIKLKGLYLSIHKKGWNLVQLVGKIAWIFTTSMLLIGLPILYAYDREKNTQLQEQPMLNMTKEQ